MYVILFVEETNAVTWLKYNREPWSEVLRLWNVTHTMRQESSAASLQEFIESWPTIEDPRAYSLVYSDKSQF